MTVITCRPTLTAKRCPGCDHSIVCDEDGTERHLDTDLIACNLTALIAHAIRADRIETS